MSARLGFYGGVGSVTGANFMLEVADARYLVDCGLVQGGEFSRQENAAAFPYDPSSIKALFVTHAHADHIGRIPKLVRDGFQGVIYSTPPTKELAAVMLEDAYHVMRAEASGSGVEPIYEPRDTAAALALWKTIPYDTPQKLPGEIDVHFTNAGHILGSAFVTFTRNGKKLAFSGDIGNVPQPLLDPPDIPADASYIVMESVYGDRTHEQVDERSDLLLAVIKQTIQERGTLIIPAFSLERTQGMLFEINNFVESGLIDPIPTFLDSPLAIRVTDLYRANREYLKKEVQEQIEGGDDIFDFPKLSFTRTVEASEDIHRFDGPKIIIAGSGMSHGGRILGHEKRYLSDPKTTLLLVGYQTVGSIGRRLQDGSKRIRIDGDDVRVGARIVTIRGYSGHADRDGLLDFVAPSSETVKQVFVAMGEERASLFLVQRLREYLGVKASAPSPGEVADIDW